MGSHLNPQTILGPLGWVGTAGMTLNVVWLLTNPRIRALARLTVLEGIRRMEFQAILLLALVLMGGMGYIAFLQHVQDMPLWGMVINKINAGSSLSPGVTSDAQAEFVRNFDRYLQSGMLFFAEAFTVGLTFALGAFAVKQDTEQGFLLTLLPKPMTRGEYLWGRGLGIFGSVAAAWLLMTIEVFLIFAVKHPEAFGNTGRPEWMILFAGGVLLMKWASLIAILFLSTQQMPPVTGTIVSFFIYVSGHFAVILHDMGTDLSLNRVARLFAWLGYILAPHYDRAWSGNILDPTANQLTSKSDVAGFLGWAWLYLWICGVWAWGFFRKRDL